MSGLSRRFEILLPLKSNDGQPFPEELLADVVLALERQFGCLFGNPDHSRVVGKAGDDFPRRTGASLSTSRTCQRTANSSWTSKNG